MREQNRKSSYIIMYILRSYYILNKEANQFIFMVRNKTADNAISFLRLM